MYEELTKARADRDAAFAKFLEESTKAARHTLKANAARHQYLLARDEVRALEFDYLSNPLHQ